MTNLELKNNEQFRMAYAIISRKYPYIRKIELYDEVDSVYRSYGRHDVSSVRLRIYINVGLMCRQLGVTPSKLFHYLNDGDPSEAYLSTDFASLSAFISSEDIDVVDNMIDNLLEELNNRTFHKLSDEYVRLQFLIICWRPVKK